jgi:hypothetical protein
VTCCRDCHCPSGYACDNNRCVQTQVCGNHLCELGETQASCCVDCGCPSGQTCSGGTCTAPTEVCGNGHCGVGESMDNCCVDCGCGSGLACERGLCRPPGTSYLTWTVISSVFTQSINYRFFDESRGLVWPAPPLAYVLSAGGSATATLTCYTGDNICFGGNGASVPTTYWGVGVNNDELCASCCRTCTDGTTSINPTP